MSLAASQGKAPVRGDSKCKFPEAGVHPKFYGYLSLLKLWKVISKRWKMQRGKARMENGNRPFRVFEANKRISGFTLSEMGVTGRSCTGKSHRVTWTLTESFWLLFSQEGNKGRDFPGAPGVKAPHSQCGEHAFNACLGNEEPTSRQHNQK